MAPKASFVATWISKTGHEWQTTIDQRGEGSNCPVCAGKMVHKDNCLATCDPEIASMWYQPQNELTPFDVTHHSGKKLGLSALGVISRTPPSRLKYKVEGANTVPVLAVVENISLRHSYLKKRIN